CIRDSTGPAPDPFDPGRAALDGIIASSMAASALETVRGGDLPLVMLDSDPADPTAAATVNLDLDDGMQQVMAHLLRRGHRRIAHIAAAVETWTFSVRARALSQAVRHVDGAMVRTEAAELSVDGGREAAERALQGRDWAPTALVCDDDVLAAGACKAVRRLGLRVPEDVSVTGFDDLALATAVEPELTTVRLPAEAVGAAGMRALRAVLEGDRPPGTTVPVSLVVRGSTAAAPRR
ncbi:LacI family transcriptional regulator, partial [Streptomyces sp. A7024]